MGAGQGIGGISFYSKDVLHTASNKATGWSELVWERCYRMQARDEDDQTPDSRRLRVLFEFGIKEQMHGTIY